MGTRRCILLILISGVVLAWYLPDERGGPAPLSTLSAALGWGYTLAWGLSFFPQVRGQDGRAAAAPAGAPWAKGGVIYRAPNPASQVVLNFRRRSVTGL
jgi:hypothetical protein